MSVERARRRCAAQPGHAELAQLDALQKLAVSCEPPEDDGNSPPCIHEHFFHFPRGFEGMSARELANYTRGHPVDPFVQCRMRTQDEAWPTVETEFRRSQRARCGT